MMRPAVMTPHSTASTLGQNLSSNSVAARQPVHAPVPAAGGHKQEQRPVNSAPGLRLHLFAGFDALVVNFHKKTAQPAGQLGTPQQNRLGKQQDDGEQAAYCR